MVTGHLKCGWSELRYTAHVKYTLDFEELVWKKNMYLWKKNIYLNFLLIHENGSMLDISGEIKLIKINSTCFSLF